MRHVITVGLLLSPIAGLATSAENSVSGLQQLGLWLQASSLGGEHRPIADAAAWHGRLMVFAWSLLLPVGVIVARFFKIMPGQDWPRTLDNPTWWHIHRLLQYSGIVLTLIGIYLIWSFEFPQADQSITVHRWLGWFVVIAGLGQIAGGLARGSKGGPQYNAAGVIVSVTTGDHYNMTRRRQWFERIHKELGYMALLMAFITTLLGLYSVGAPRWMLLTIITWWLLLAVGFMLLQGKIGCVDTYQAIWGANPQHPGNALKPLGWGIHRRQASAELNEE